MDRLNKYGLNYEEQTILNNTVRQYGLTDYGKSFDKITIHPAEKKPHFQAKCNICFLLKKQGRHFLTEFPVKGKNSKTNIPDVLVLKPLIAIEILSSEKHESFEKKEQKSADGLHFLEISAADARDLKTAEDLML